MVFLSPATVLFALWIGVVLYAIVSVIGWLVRR